MCTPHTGGSYPSDCDEADGGDTKITKGTRITNN